MTTINDRELNELLMKAEASIHEAKALMTAGRIFAVADKCADASDAIRKAEYRCNDLIAWSKP